MTKVTTGERHKTQVRTQNGTFNTKLTRKQKAFADQYINEPNTSATEIASRVYNVTDRATAGVIATQNLKKDNIRVYLDKHVDKAVLNIVKLADNADNETVRLNANRDILDRNTGKAIQRTEQITTGITLNIDLSGTGVSLDAPKDTNSD